jgi:hypothetical protein
MQVDIPERGEGGCYAVQLILSRMRSFWSWPTTDCISVLGMRKCYHFKFDTSILSASSR